MAHPEQRAFCKRVRKRHPAFFRCGTVCDVGSMDINGNNRYLFGWCVNYTGVDIAEGKNVDVVAKAHLFFIFRVHAYQTVVCTEMLEHDRYWEDSLRAMYAGTVPGGLLLITAASYNRAEHGTHEHDGWTSPATLDYYQNITMEMLSDALPPGLFKEYHLEYGRQGSDIYFYGIKQ